MVTAGRQLHRQLADVRRLNGGSGTRPGRPVQGPNPARYSIDHRRAAAVVQVRRSLRWRLGNIRRAVLRGEDVRQHVGIDPALPEGLAVALQIDVLRKRLLRPHRCLVIASGPK